MRILFLFSFSLLLFSGCKPAGSSSTSDQPNDTKALEDELMAIHDEVMPKITDIQRLSSELRDIKMSVTENQNGKIDLPDGLQQNLESLKLAEQGMWDWMKGYHDTRDSIPADQLEHYLKHQMELIKSVQNLINTSITKSQAWLAENGKKDVQ